MDKKQQAKYLAIVLLELLKEIDYPYCYAGYSFVKMIEGLIHKIDYYEAENDMIAKDKSNITKQMVG